MWSVIFLMTSLMSSSMNFIKQMYVHIDPIYDYNSVRHKLTFFRTFPSTGEPT